jgi:hypothetical protein
MTHYRGIALWPDNPFYQINLRRPGSKEPGRIFFEEGAAAPKQLDGQLPPIVISALRSF